MRSAAASEVLAPEHELARLLSSTARRREERAARIAELAEIADGERLSSFARMQGMGPLLAARFVAAAPAADAGWTRWWRSEGAERHVMNALRHRAAWNRIADALESAGIPALALKGAVLAEQLYGDEAMRGYLDVDVLVPRALLPRAMQPLRQLGYFERASGGRQSSLHVALEHAEGVLPPLDLHWRVHWLEDAFSRDMLERSRRHDGIREADPCDQLVSLLLFYARDGFQGLRLAADIAAWWDHLDRDVQPRGLVSYLQRYPALEAALTASALVAEELVGLPGRRLLGTDGGFRRRVAIATRLTDWQLVRERDQAAADVSLVDGLSTPPGELGTFARRYLFCDARRIAGIYDVPMQATARLRMWQAIHPLKILARYALALRATGLGRAVYRVNASTREESRHNQL